MNPLIWVSLNIEVFLFFLQSGHIQIPMATSSTWESSTRIMSLSSELLPPVVSYLETHEDTQRIQKLIFCLCKKYWENDPTVLQNFSLDQLLPELIQVKPSIEQLTFSMYKLVKTLNRPKIYAAVAKVILDQLAPIYRHENDQNNQINLSEVPEKKEAQAVDQNFLAEQIADKLAQHPESSRMVKLIYAACKDSWENDAEVINRYGVKNLITELRNTYPTKSEVQFVFNQLVANINKQTLYLAIANLILSQMDCLYENFDESVEDDNPANQTLKTQILQNPAKFSLTRANHRQDIQTSIIDINAESIETALKPSGQLANSLPAVPKSYNLFELRLEIMQNTNPLRAKILLFSIRFRTWDNSGQDWSMLRSYGVDDLLDQVILSGQSFKSIESQLYKQAESLPDKETYLQTASAILQTLKSVF